MRGHFRIYPSGNPGVQIVEAASHHQFARHTHDQYGIGVIHQGAQKSISGRGMVEAGPGHLITVNPGEVHDGIPIGEAGRSWRMIYFDPEIIQLVENDMREDVASIMEFTEPASINALAAKQFQHLFNALTSPNCQPLLQDEMLIDLLSQTQKNTREQKHMPSAIRIIKQLIDDEPTATLTLADLAKASGLSRFQVLRSFATATGFTPHSYLMQRRADLARRMILQGAALAETAAASGFSDQSHMNRVFVHKYGISPGIYAASVI
ncbi:AraC family transcriptional regulator [Phyllobacterium sp. YR531]|uniref:AraC family transcriptional regulator n=1 Tax=Phyllobacterium sp. YR531 TaxID=1144343 RepID=UPI00059330FF|nr:AraC family transcriptional regulator [Phyllobacterium sp. YR531]